MSYFILENVNWGNPYWNIGFKSVWVCENLGVHPVGWFLLTVSFRTYQAKEHQLEKKKKKKTHTETRGADLSWLSWFCVLLVRRFQGEWWSRGFLSNHMKLPWGRDGCVAAWAMMPGWRGNIAKSFCDIISRGTVSSSHVLSCSVVSYKLLTSVETTHATD